MDNQVNQGEEIMDYDLNNSITPGIYGEKKTFKAYNDIKEPGRLWLIAEQDNAADNIFVGFPYDTKSQGFYGDWLTFEIDTGTKIRLQGPWHSNSKAMYENTGIDIRDKSKTFVVIGNGYVPNNNGLIKDIIYKDDDFVIGRHERGDKLAQKYANELGHPVFRWVRGMGGSHSGWIYPEGTNFREWESGPNFTLKRK